VASGGEISRPGSGAEDLPHAPRTAVVRTLVFDEVDAGVGGSAAEGIGRRLKKLAAANQVLASRTCRRLRPSPTITTASRSRNRKAGRRRGRGAGLFRPHPRIGRMLVGAEAHARGAENAEQLIRLSVA